MNCPKSFSLPISILEIVELSKQGTCQTLIVNRTLFEVDSKSIRSRFEVDSKSLRSRFDVDSNSIRTRFEVDSKSIRTRFMLQISIIIFFTGAWTQRQPTNLEFVQSTVQELLTGPILLKPQHLPRHPRLLMEFMSGKLVLFP